MDSSIFILIAIGLVLYGLSKFKNSAKKPARPNSTRTKATPKAIQEDISWLNTRWLEIDNFKKQNAPNIVADWYFDEPTKWQMEKLSESKIALPKFPLKKGHASDLIGLKASPEDDELEILKFFKLPTAKLSQTKARHMIGHLFLSPSNKKAWDDRPPTAIQKDCIKFFNLKSDTPLTKLTAQKIIEAHLKGLPDDDTKLRIWIAVESASEELSDKETREDYGIKKPTTSLLVKTVEHLVAAGTKPEEISIDAITEHIIEIKPEMEL